MAILSKPSTVSGEWVKGSEVPEGVKVRIKSEAQEQPSTYTDKRGNIKNQIVAKVQIQGKTGLFNLSLNKATVVALINCYGEDTLNWIDKVFTAHTEKVKVAGKTQVALYLVPDGYVAEDNEEGYTVVHEIKQGNDQAPEPKGDMFEEMEQEAKPNPDDAEINESDIPF